MTRGELGVSWDSDGQHVGSWECRWTVMGNTWGSWECRGTVMGDTWGVGSVVGQ